MNHEICYELRCGGKVNGSYLYEVIKDLEDLSNNHHSAFKALCKEARGSSESISPENFKVLCEYGFMDKSSESIPLKLESIILSATKQAPKNDEIYRRDDFSLVDPIKKF